MLLPKGLLRLFRPDLLPTHRTAVHGLHDSASILSCIRVASTSTLPSSFTRCRWAQQTATGSPASRASLETSGIYRQYLSKRALTLPRPMLGIRPHRARLSLSRDLPVSFCEFPLGLFCSLHDSMYSNIFLRWHRFSWVSMFVRATRHRVCCSFSRYRLYLCPYILTSPC